MAACTCMCLRKSLQKIVSHTGFRFGKRHYSIGLRCLNAAHYNGLLFRKHVVSFSVKRIAYCSTKTQNLSGLADQVARQSFGKGQTDQQNTQDEERKAKEDLDKKREAFNRRMQYTFLAFGLLGSAWAGFAIWAWGAPRVDEEGREIRDEFSDMPPVTQYVLRAWSEVKFYEKMIKEPSREKLLPDPLTEPYYQPPYTLVLEMTGILVHPDWTYGTGWRFKKRPGIDYFLQQVGPPLFEVIIFTQEQGFTAYPIIDSLDPQGYIMYRLFRDATRYEKGHHIKDLSCLNRDLSKVIIVDWNPKAIGLQPRNALQIRKWNGNDDDRSLFELATFLRTIAVSGVDDVREVLDHYKDEDDPLAAFKRNQQVLQEQQQRLLQQQAEAEKSKSILAGFGRGFGRK